MGTILMLVCDKYDLQDVSFILGTKTLYRYGFYEKHLPTCAISEC